MSLIGNLTSEVNVIMTSHVVARPLWSRTTQLAATSTNLGAIKQTYRNRNRPR